MRTIKVLGHTFGLGSAVRCPLQVNGVLVQAPKEALHDSILDKFSSREGRKDGSLAWVLETSFSR